MCSVGSELFTYINNCTIPVKHYDGMFTLLAATHMAKTESVCSYLDVSMHNIIITSRESCFAPTWQIVLHINLETLMGIGNQSLTINSVLRTFQFPIHLH